MQGAATSEIDAVTNEERTQSRKKEGVYPLCPVRRQKHNNVQVQSSANVCTQKEKAPDGKGPDGWEENIELRRYIGEGRSSLSGQNGMKPKGEWIDP